MVLEAFLHNLHFDNEKITPPDWEVDWDDAPLAYKLYRGLPVVPLSLEVPLTLDGRGIPAKPDLRTIGHFLWYTFGLTQVSQLVPPLDSTENTVDFVQSYRRFVPSGGALYPNELYVYLKLEDLPAGVYHYDVAHHSLVLLREGNFDSYIARALGHRYDEDTCFGTVFVSTMFWKNFYKYNNFAYRLQGLDAGVVIGQLLEVAKSFGFASGVFFQFLDRAINHLLGLSEQEESVYAVIPLSVEPTNWSNNRSDVAGIVSADELCRELTSLPYNHYQRSQKVAECPFLTMMNEASMLESTQSFRKIEVKKNLNCDGQAQVLPRMKRMSYDLAAVCRERYSPEMDFVLGKVSQSQLANLLQETIASFSYRNDLDVAHSKQESRVSLYVCLYNVEGIQDGAYYYDSAAHVLRQVDLGDHRLELQKGLVGFNVNLHQVPLCLNVAGDSDHLIPALGYRGYRIQQMEAGMLTQRLLLSATAIGMGGHPLLGFNAKMSDEIFKIDTHGKTSLIQIPIGPYRQRPWMKGSLHS
ncbi:SagB family peptide dehydrogenase [Bacillus sp. FJAT-29790]|uniref:SagB family peptide dehydrogenase n=1 Tax=Bacillus sp. FJAT-29790 TaxID=1895002 RepID=UPI001C221403|nr:SagB family peptide dehydrogenase [Bacillus sp. FJAT-29790]MBU8878110.1 SagB family peptide dehydrogenase [Bacillus sp. FJAT-29790]